MKKVLLSSILLTALVSCASNNQTKIEKYIVSSMSNVITSINDDISFPFNTVMTLQYFLEEENKEAIKEDITNMYLEDITHLHKVFDRHYYYQENDQIVTSVKTINDSYATGNEIQCSQELYSLLKLGHHLTILSDGLYNFYMGGLVDYWDRILLEICDDPYTFEAVDPYFENENKALLDDYLYTIPSLKDIENIMEFNDETMSVKFNSIDDVVIDDITYSRKDNKSMYRPYITPGGIAKGFANDIIKEHLLSKNYNRGFLNSGTSSITLLSEPTFNNSKTLSLGFIDPRKANLYENNVAFRIKIKDEVQISTSGNYTSGKSYAFKDEQGNKIYRHHIINPRNAEPSQYHRSLTVISKTFTSGELDALSTCLMNLSLEDAFNFRKKLLNLKEYKNHDLDIIFIDDGDITKDTLNISVTSNFNNSLEIVAKDCSVYYEK